MLFNAGPGGAHFNCQLHHIRRYKMIIFVYKHDHIDVLYVKKKKDLQSNYSFQINVSEVKCAIFFSEMWWRKNMKWHKIENIKIVLYSTFFHWSPRTLLLCILIRFQTLR